MQQDGEELMMTLNSIPDGFSLPVFSIKVPVLYAFVKLFGY